MLSSHSVSCSVRCLSRPLVAGECVAPLRAAERVTKLILGHDGEGESLAQKVPLPPAWRYLRQGLRRDLHVARPAASIEDRIGEKLPAASAALLGNGDVIPICEDLPFRFVMTTNVDIPRHLPYT